MFQRKFLCIELRGSQPRASLMDLLPSTATRVLTRTISPLTTPCWSLCERRCWQPHPLSRPACSRLRDRNAMPDVSGWMAGRLSPRRFGRTVRASGPPTLLSIVAAPATTCGIAMIVLNGLEEGSCTDDVSKYYTTLHPFVLSHSFSSTLCIFKWLDNILTTVPTLTC